MTELAPRARCVRCGYDLRGNASAVCPECGAPTSAVAVRVNDPLQFHRARAALESEKLLLNSVEPGGRLGVFAFASGFPDVSGWLWVDPNYLNRVEDCLDRAGVVSQIGTRPIVDRSDPICPTCDHNLNADGPETCPHCGAEFQWVDIDEPEIDPTGVNCRWCGYDLTGNKNDRCPECGNQYGGDPGLLVAAALGELNESDSASPEQRPSAAESFHAALFVIVMTAALALIGHLIAAVDDPIALIIGLVLLAGAMSYLALIRQYIVHRRRSQR